MANTNFGELFEIELDCWCYGLERTTERIDRSVLHQVIKEFSGVLREAVENLYICDIVATTDRLIASSKCGASKKEIAFHILSYLPSPRELNAKQNAVLNETIQQVENSYGGAFERLKKKWQGTRKHVAAIDKTSDNLSFESLSLPSLSQ